MNPAWLSFCLLFALNAQAHREHKAHAHGQAQLTMAFDQIQGSAEFETPAEAIVGFEHEAKSAKDLQRKQEAFLKFEKDFPQMLKLDPALKCQFHTDSIEMKTEGGGHADFVASFKIQCEKSPLGTALTLDFSSYKGLKMVKATILAGTIQKSVDVKSKPVRVELKP
jgi:hypothetical protein